MQTKIRTLLGVPAALLLGFIVIFVFLKLDGLKTPISTCVIYSIISTVCISGMVYWDDRRTQKKREEDSSSLVNLK